MKAKSLFINEIIQEETRNEKQRIKSIKRQKRKEERRKAKEEEDEELIEDKSPNSTKKVRKRVNFLEGYQEY